MEFNNGYIKLYRSILDWEWWDSPKTRDLFIYLLLAANWEDKRWRGIWVRRGQLVTSRDELAKAVGISVSSVRTSLDRLKSTNEITFKTTHQYTLITIVNYEKYQGNDINSTNEIANETTNESPSSDQQIATTKESKNIRTKEFIIPPLSPLTDEERFRDMTERGMKVLNGGKE